TIATFQLTPKAASGEFVRTLPKDLNTFSQQIDTRHILATDMAPQAVATVSSCRGLNPRDFLLRENIRYVGKDGEIYQPQIPVVPQLLPEQETANFKHMTLRFQGKPMPVILTPSSCAAVAVIGDSGLAHPYVQSHLGPGSIVKPDAQVIEVIFEPQAYESRTENEANTQLSSTLQQASGTAVWLPESMRHALAVVQRDTSLDLDTKVNLLCSAFFERDLIYTQSPGVFEIIAGLPAHLRYSFQAGFAAGKCDTLSYELQNYLALAGINAVVESGPVFNVLSDCYVYPGHSRVLVIDNNMTIDPTLWTNKTLAIAEISTNAAMAVVASLQDNSQEVAYQMGCSLRKSTQYHNPHAPTQRDGHQLKDDFRKLEPHEYLSTEEFAQALFECAQNTSEGDTLAFEKLLLSKKTQSELRLATSISWAREMDPDKDFVVRNCIAYLASKEEYKATWPVIDSLFKQDNPRALSVDYDSYAHIAKHCLHHHGNHSPHAEDLLQNSIRHFFVAAFAPEPSLSDRITNAHKEAIGPILLSWAKELSRRPASLYETCALQSTLSRINAATDLFPEGAIAASSHAMELLPVPIKLALLFDLEARVRYKNPIDGSPQLTERYKLLSKEDVEFDEEPGDFQQDLLKSLGEQRDASVQESWPKLEILLRELLHKLFEEAESEYFGVQLAEDKAEPQVLFQTSMTETVSIEEHFPFALPAPKNPMQRGNSVLLNVMRVLDRVEHFLDNCALRDPQLMSPQISKFVSGLLAANQIKLPDWRGESLHGQAVRGILELVPATNSVSEWGFGFDLLKDPLKNPVEDSTYITAILARVVSLTEKNYLDAGALSSSLVEPEKTVPVLSRWLDHLWQQADEFPWKTSEHRHNVAALRSSPN
ncbi:MAG: hypothetical protein KDD62_07610, partial [Bdellovibrionales bacterium]|nr:hypothetical protein [Bdellovibrionales bacterium]